MESFYQRIVGLRTALTVKFHQVNMLLHNYIGLLLYLFILFKNDLHIVDSLDIPSDSNTVFFFSISKQNILL